MIRIDRFALALAVWAGFAMAPAPALAACAQWDMNGTWKFAQSNLSINSSPIFTLRQAASDLQGEGWFQVKSYSRRAIGIGNDTNYVEVTGTVRGVVNGDTLELTAFWTLDDSIGVYTGRIDPQGRIEGSTYDKRDPQNTATWVSVQTAKCLVVASPPPPAAPPPAASLPPAGPVVRAQGRVRLDPANTSPSPMRPVCEVAAQARARNSPAAPGLAARCVEQQFLKVDALAAKGEAIAMEDPLAIELRQQQPDDSAQRGFDIGMAAAEGQTEPGPGKQRIHDALNSSEQAGFDAAVSYSLANNKHGKFAALGASIAAANPAVAAMRNRRADVLYRQGFDISTSLFGYPELGGQGNRGKGPVSLGVRAGLSEAGKRGFDAAADYFGIPK